MAKGLRSKVKKRFRTLKRRHVDNVVLEQTPPNYFKHPNDPNAIVPQYKMPNMLDLRSSNIPIAGKEFVGAYRKKIVHEDEQKKQKQNQKMIEEEPNAKKQQKQSSKQIENEVEEDESFEDDDNKEDGVIEFSETDLLDFNKMSIDQMKKKIDKQIKQTMNIEPLKSKKIQKIQKKKKNIKDKVACKKSRSNIRSFGRKKI